MRLTLFEGSTLLSISIEDLEDISHLQLELNYCIKGLELTIVKEGGCGRTLHAERLFEHGELISGHLTPGFGGSNGVLFFPIATVV